LKKTTLTIFSALAIVSLFILTAAIGIGSVSAANDVTQDDDMKIMSGKLTFSYPSGSTVKNTTVYLDSVFEKTDAYGKVTKTTKTTKIGSYPSKSVVSTGFSVSYDTTATSYNIRVVSELTTYKIVCGKGVFTTNFNNTNVISIIPNAYDGTKASQMTIPIVVK
jgi:hypothetical protein